MFASRQPASVGYNGRYEDHSATLELESVPKDTETSVLVRVGYAQSRKFFPIAHLVPKRTTRRPMYISEADAVSMTSVLGQRVVVIGPDLSGDSSAVGLYGIVVFCGYALQPGHAMILITSKGPLHERAMYFHEDSLCRSNQDA